MLVLSKLCFTSCVPVLVVYGSPVACTGIYCVQGNTQLEWFYDLSSVGLTRQSIQEKHGHVFPFLSQLSLTAPGCCCSVLHSQTLLFRNGTEAALCLIFLFEMHIPLSLKLQTHAEGLCNDNPKPGTLSSLRSPSCKTCSELSPLVAKVSRWSPGEAQGEYWDTFIYLWHILSAVVVKLWKWGLSAHWGGLGGLCIFHAVWSCAAR